MINEVDGDRFKASFDYEEDEWSLFNLSKDVGEEKNLATVNKKVLVTLAKQLDDWLVKNEPTWQPKYPIRKTVCRQESLPAIIKSCEKFLSVCLT